MTNPLGSDPIDHAAISLFNKFANHDWFQTVQKTLENKLVITVSELNEATAELCRDGWQGFQVLVTRGQLFKDNAGKMKMKKLS